MTNLPKDLCTPTALGKIRKDIGTREENFVANICKIKETSDEVLDTFTKVSKAEAIAPTDRGKEIGFYNKKLARIKNLANATQIR